MFKTRMSSLKQAYTAIGFQFLDSNNVFSVHENVIIGSSYGIVITLRIILAMFDKNVQY